MKKIIMLILFILSEVAVLLPLRICQVYPLSKIVVLTAYQAILINIDNGYAI